jgi:ankyrin repeat protein
MYRTSLILLFSVSCVGCTPPGKELRRAAAAGHVDEVNQLLAEYPQCVNDSDPSTGQTALEFGVISRHEDIVKALLTHGASVDHYDKFKFSCMYFAILNDDWPIVQLLLDNGAQIKDARYKYGSTPLMVAAMAGSQSIAEHLLALGADPNTRDDEGHTAADLARADGYKELVELLEKHMTTQPTTSKSSGVNSQ